jgi:hypothetical protein
MSGNADLSTLVHHLRGTIQHIVEKDLSFALVELHYGPLGYVELYPW